MTGPSRIHGLYAIADWNEARAARREGSPTPFGRSSSQSLTRDGGSADTPELQFVHSVREALAGGARVIQYRDKTGPSAVREGIARALLEACRAHGALFLINDDVALAHATGADGVHLGQDDMGIADARGRLGAKAVIGASCYNDLARARAAEQAGADYVAFGRFFPSRTKPEAVAATPDLLRQARAVLHVPIVAIGGITPDNGRLLIEAGADALAAIEGLFGQADVRAAARRYSELFAS